MAQYKIKGGEDLIQCPFDNTHMVRQSRMQYHLMDCKKNHPGQKYEVCQFNARHYVLKPEYEHHKQNCPDRALIEIDLVYASKAKGGTYFTGDCSVPDYSHKVVKYDDGEDWETECEADAKPFKWGESLDDHFHSKDKPYGFQAPDYQHSQHVRRPHGVPQVLRTHNGIVAVETSSSSRQRLPNSLPQTHRPAPTLLPGGIARGRGVGTLQNHEPPTVGLSSQQIAEEAVKPKGRGRGRGKKKANGSVNGLLASMGPTGYSDDDAASTSSNSSEMSGSSRSSRGVPRRVNADPVGVGKPVPFKPQATVPQLTPQAPAQSSQQSFQPSQSVFKPVKSQPTYPQCTPPEPARSSMSYAHRAAAPSPTLPRSNPAPQVMPGPTNPTPQPQALPANPAPQGIRPHFGLLGIGRGAGRVFNPQAQAEPGFIIPNVNRNGNVNATKTQEQIDDAKKQIRKCEKKIREIEALEAKRSQGVELNESEETKIYGKKDLLRQLRELRLN